MMLHVLLIHTEHSRLGASPPCLPSAINMESAKHKTQKLKTCSLSATVPCFKQIRFAFKTSFLFWDGGKDMAYVLCEDT